MESKRPMATAPTDGRWILLGGGWTEERWSEDPDDQIDQADTGRPVVAKWIPAVSGLHEGYWTYAHWDSGWRSSYSAPSYWMPLP